MTIQGKAQYVVEPLLVVVLSLLAMSLYFPWPNINRYGLISLLLLMLWRYGIKRTLSNTIPLSVVILSVLFFLCLVMSAAVSHNSEYYFFEYKAFRYFIIGGLLFSAPLNDRYRTIIITALFSFAAIDAFVGIMQYSGLIPVVNDRPNGFAMRSTLYAAKLAFIAGTGSLLLLCRNRTLYRSSAGTVFLYVTTGMTWLSILLSGSRGTWFALPAALIITITFISRKKALLVLCIILAVVSISFKMDKALQYRMTSMMNTSSLHNAKWSIGNRIELIKGAIYLFQENPIFGVGAGDFQEHIEKLVQQNKLKEMTSMIHAHNLFLHILATEGLVGFTVFISLSSALLWWGVTLIWLHNDIGGQVILFCAILVLMLGLTDYYFASPHYIGLWYLMTGLLGPIGLRNQERSIDGAALNIVA